MGVKWGLLSTARINEQILAAMARTELASVVAVASRHKEHAEAYARSHGIPRAFGSYQELLEDPEVEVVYLSLPNSMHVEWTIRALRAGKHVLCEKPLTRWAGPGSQAFNAADEAGRILMEGFMYRHHPQTRRTQELVADGAVGRVQFLRASLSFELQDAGNIRLSADLEGGAVMDLGCYCVSSLRMIGGEAISAFGIQIAAGGVDTRFAGMLRFPDDVIGQFDVALTQPLRSRLEIVGSAGSIVLADPWVCASPGIDLIRAGKTEHIEIDRVDHYQLEIDNLSRAIRGLESPLIGRRDALGQARTIEALYMSAEAGRAVALEEVGA
jgi:xylose dehydrogenase (NAD/NADP)